MSRNLHRRRFLQQTLGGAAVAAIVPTLRSGADDAEPADLRLGFSLYGMKTVPIDDALRHCAEIGYQHVELALLAGYPTEAKLLSAANRRALRDRLAVHRLTASALMDNLSLAVDDATHAAHQERIRAAAELAHALDPESPPVLESILGGKPAEWDTIRDRMAERAADWARLGAEHRLTICLKPHISSAVNTPERLLWLHRQVASPFLKLCYDYSHFQLQNLGLEATLDPLIGDIRFIHLKDTAGDARNVQFLLPGTGTTDYPAYFARLLHHHWRGPLCVEVSSMVFNKPGYDPIAGARQCYAKLAPALGR